ncbi:MAG TPA: entericidin A/B family lipoprotein [Phycisphaerales bacterium]|nr:entericidin A/B family lipoprotein [Phycisphaerales bacterium]
MKRFLNACVAALLLVSWAFIVTGCNTVHGAGKDVEKTGEAIQDASD